jgi:AAA+ ATPase superfamily predicted ATPase
MQRLFGRQRELADLDTAWRRAQSGVPQLAVFWGRRRVGKTFLLTRFAEGKRAVYFTATRQDSMERQLARLAERVGEQLGGAGQPTFPLIEMMEAIGVWRFSPRRIAGSEAAATGAR